MKKLMIATMSVFFMLGASQVFAEDNMGKGAMGNDQMGKNTTLKDTMKKTK